MAFELVRAWDDNAHFICDVPTKTGKPKTFKVPKMQFLDRDVFVAFRAWLDEHDDETLSAEGLRPQEEGFDFLVLQLDIPNAKWFIDNLVFGEKLQLWEEWNRVSMMPLGESGASSSD